MGVISDILVNFHEFIDISDILVNFHEFIDILVDFGPIIDSFVKTVTTLLFGPIVLSVLVSFSHVNTTGFSVFQCLLVNYRRKHRSRDAFIVKTPKITENT